MWYLYHRTTGKAMPFKMRATPQSLARQIDGVGFQPPSPTPPAAGSQIKIVRQRLDELYLVAFADSAGGRVNVGARKTSQRSRSAIVVAAQDELERIFTLKAWARHCTTDELIDEIIRTNREWHPIAFGIDASGNQGMFSDAIRREIREKGLKLPLTDIIFQGDKDWRIETTLQPLQSAGKLFALPDQNDLRAEYQAFPGGNFKDILDALVGCTKLFPLRVKAEEARDELRQYREYLRSQKLSEEVISRKLREERAYLEHGFKGG